MCWNSCIFFVASSLFWKISKYRKVEIVHEWMLIYLNLRSLVNFCRIIFESKLLQIPWHFTPKYFSYFSSETRTFFCITLLPLKHLKIALMQYYLICNPYADFPISVFLNFYSRVNSIIWFYVSSLLSSLIVPIPQVFKIVCILWSLK